MLPLDWIISRLDMVLNMGKFEVGYLEAINYGLQAAPTSGV